MTAYLAIFLAFMVGALAYAKTGRKLQSWLTACLVVPVFVLFAAFVLPYQGGGASMWPVALLFGGAMGAVAAGAGVVLASWWQDRRS
jgi:hypothetical protein